MESWYSFEIVTSGRTGVRARGLKNRNPFTQRVVQQATDVQQLSLCMDFRTDYLDRSGLTFANHAFCWHLLVLQAILWFSDLFTSVYADISIQLCWELLGLRNGYCLCFLWSWNTLSRWASSSRELNLPKREEIRESSTMYCPSAPG